VQVSRHKVHGNVKKFNSRLNIGNLPLRPVKTREEKVGVVVCTCSPSHFTWEAKAGG
jgi:hypothetical protein